jgi:hypothetical protein
MTRALKTALISTLALALVPQAAHAAWTRTYVIEWIEQASYYGAKQGIIDPGTDCPKGTNPEPNWIESLMKSGAYTKEEAEWIRNPANPERSAVSGNPKMGLRGKNRASVYREPWTSPDPGILEVEGTIGEGIDLDGDKANGFTNLLGEPGIDNKFYRALGCWKSFRGPPRLSSGAQTVNDPMREGSWTMLVVVHGEGDDPMNDDKVTVGVYNSSDKLVRSGDGRIVEDYSFSIAPNARYEGIFPAKVKDGRITSTQAVDWMMRDPSPGSVRTGLEILKGQIDLTMKPDGSLKGYFGGYRPWQPVYTGWAGFGQVNEVLTWIDLPAAWYAMKRHADYAPTPGGEKTHISFALRVDALPAFVLEPDASTEVAAIKSYKAMAAANPPPAAPARAGAAAPRAEAPSVAQQAAR